MKKVLLLSLALILLLGITSHGTSGYFSDTETSAGNTFTAWVEVCEPGSTILVSDTTTQVTEAYTQTSTSPHTPHHAVLAWVHGDWGDIDYDFGSSEDDAKWIWETYRTDDPGAQAPIDGRVVRFVRTFDIPCSPVGATLHITVDNGYTVWINSHLVGSAQVNTGWETSDLTEDFVHTDNWRTVETYTIPSTDLVAGTNVLVILAANEYYGTDNNEHDSAGTADSNPAGLIYWLEVEWGY